MFEFLIKEIYIRINVMKIPVQEYLVLSVPFKVQNHSNRSLNFWSRDMNRNKRIFCFFGTILTVPKFILFG